MSNSNHILNLDIILRPKGKGKYELVSGHRRKEACLRAGLSMIRAEVREMTQDEAIILMVDSNLQRTELLPSEKAFSYKMRLEAIKRQGKRTDLTFVPTGYEVVVSLKSGGFRIGWRQ